LVILRAAPLSVVEKAALYVTATILVYLDALALPAAGSCRSLPGSPISIAAMATAVRLRLAE